MQKNMVQLTPRLEMIFEKTKTVCFGRFLVDVPETTKVAWGNSDVPLGVSIYVNGASRVQELGNNFINELNGEKAINHNNIPLLIAVDRFRQPEGRVIIGYEDFQAINGLAINGYFKLGNDGVVIQARPLKNMKEKVVADIASLASRLQMRDENEIPTVSGNCIEHGFLPDRAVIETESSFELLSIGFRLKEFPDAHLSIYLAPANPYHPDGDSLAAQFKRIKEDPMSNEEKKVLDNTKFFRESSRQIQEWKNGYEVLMRTPDEEGALSHHDFLMKFIGVPKDPLRPYADIQFQTGVAKNAAGATKASPTDEEALAIWDKITSTIRVRPTDEATAKTAGAGSSRDFPLGELAATGRTCPQTGWWEPEGTGGKSAVHRQHIKAGELMPHVIALGRPTLWQKLLGERPSYRRATIWKLVDYGHSNQISGTDKR
jgi:hypothetical protein